MTPVLVKCGYIGNPQRFVCLQSALPSARSNAAELPSLLQGPCEPLGFAHTKCLKNVQALKQPEPLLGFAKGGKLRNLLSLKKLPRFVCNTALEHFIFSIP